MSPRRRPLALTMGEPAGIGGEITLKAWRSLAAGSSAFFAIDDPERLTEIARSCGMEAAIETIGDPREAASVFPRALPVLPLPLRVPTRPGQPDTANAECVLESIRRAVKLTLEGVAAAVVTNPIHKKTLAQAGFMHPGHTEFLAELCGVAAPVMMLACPGLRVVPVTIHCPLEKAIATLSTDAISSAARTTARALTEDFGIAAPRLAVAGLNPHAGEHGVLGREEQEIIAPAVQALLEEGLAVTGPEPADSLFHVRAREAYDAVICMYHDQALIPLKTVDFDHGVDITLGLPIVRTSPDHGTAFEIAGRGVARESSLITAMGLAAEMAERRMGLIGPSRTRRVLAGG